MSTAIDAMVKRWKKAFPQATVIREKTPEGDVVGLRIGRHELTHLIDDRMRVSLLHSVESCTADAVRRFLEKSIR